MKELKVGEEYLYQGDNLEDTFKVELLYLEHPDNKDACVVRKLSDNTLFWSCKSRLKPVDFSLSDLSWLFEELDVEIEKAGNCEKYLGVVFVHPQDIDNVRWYISNLSNAESEIKGKRFTFTNGGILILDTLYRGYSSSLPQYDYAGLEITTTIIHHECFGKYVDNKYVPVNEVTSRGGANQDFIMYMLSRNRSESRYSPRLVIV